MQGNQQPAGRCAVVVCAIPAVLDRRSRGSSFVAGAVAVPPALALLLLEAPHPLELAHFARSVSMAIILGALGAAALTVLAKLLPAPPKTAAVVD